MVFSSVEVLWFFMPAVLRSVPESSITLPIGISFFTLHALSYVVDVVRRARGAPRVPGSAHFVYDSFGEAARPMLQRHFERFEASCGATRRAGG